jgi:dTDP-3-amino-3,4,6-trideoxy-alpha-D-glucose transaminase
VNVPFLDLRAAHEELRGPLEDAFRRVLETGVFVLGSEVEALETEFAQLVGTRHCVAVGSGFDALRLLLLAHGIGPGDEVVVPAYTAVATWLAVSATGATPVGVDVDPRTRTIDPDRISEALTPRTKAIVPVHLFGRPAEMDGVGEIAARHGLPLIEDAAQAHGAKYRGRRVGSLGRGAAFSFYPTKNLGALGDGGAVTTDDDDLADTVRLLRSYGWRARSESEVKGGNSRLDELQAALLRAKLEVLDAWTGRRRAHADSYLADLAGMGTLSLPDRDPHVEPVWHLFVVAAEGRDELRRSLADRGIGTLVHYEPLPHLTPAFRDDGWREGAFPHAETLARTAISLPLHPQLSAEERDYVAAAVRQCGEVR